jgi:hypothetical protein
MLAAARQDAVCHRLMSWLGKFGQWDKWSFCLIAARLAAEQENR